MDDHHLTAESLMYATVLFCTPLILLCWFWGHKLAMKCLADGESVIHQPDKHEKIVVWQLEASPYPAVIRPHIGPLMYLGATASAGMLRRWCIYMAALCALILLFRCFRGDQPWFGCLGYVFLFMVPLYLGDINVVQDDLKKPIRTFALIQALMGSALSLSFARLMGWMPFPDVVFYSLVVASLLLFINLAALPVPSDDIVHQIREWKKNYKYKWWPPGR